MAAFDIALFHLINGLAGHPGFDTFFLFLSWIGEGGAIWIALAFLIVLGAGRLPGLRGPGSARWRAVGIGMLGALALAGVTQAVLKDMVKRPRPPLVLPGVHLIGSLPASYSFPSGHTLSSVAAAMVLLTALRRLAHRGQPLGPVADGWVVMLLAGLIGFSRIYIGVHFPSDVLVGAVLGAMEGWVVWVAGEWVLSHQKPSRSLH
jgi:undecaprenyl-diphosphatase